MIKSHSTSRVLRIFLSYFVLVIVAVLLNPGASHAQLSSEQRLQSIIDEVSVKKVPGIILLVEGPNVNFHGARGYANRKTKEKMQFEYSLRAGSICKTYIASLAVMAANDGRLDLDLSIDQYLDEDILTKLPKRLRPTSRQLLNHTSGVPDYYGVRFYIKDWKDRGPLTTDLVLHAIRGKNATNEPGVKFSYSNTNYHLMALILENIYDQSLEKLLHDHIFEPIGLETTYYNQHFPPGDKIHGYGAPTKPWIDTYEWQENTGPDGGVIASANDLALWIRTLFSENGKLSKIGDAMILNPVVQSERKLQGMGVELLRSRSGVNVIGHTGSADGYLTAAFYVPTKDTVIVLHMNKSDEKRFGGLLSAVLKEVISQ